MLLGAVTMRSGFVRVGQFEGRKRESTLRGATTRTLLVCTCSAGLRMRSEVFGSHGRCLRRRLALGVAPYPTDEARILALGGLFVRCPRGVELLEPVFVPAGSDVAKSFYGVR